MQCTDSDLFALRDLTARLSCVRPTTKSRTLAVSSSLDSNTGIRYQRVDHIELDVSPTERRGIPRVGWAVDPLWKRMQHLLVSTGLARDDNELYSFIVEHGDVRRLHGLVKQRGIREGKYLCYRSGFDNEHSAELVLMPCCFGYGSTPEEALASLKENLVLFVEDAATAELVKTPRPS
jgi:predicted RNase H-like HicB family nuclease